MKLLCLAMFLLYFAMNLLYSAMFLLCFCYVLLCLVGLALRQASFVFALPRYAQDEQGGRINGA